MHLNQEQIAKLEPFLNVQRIICFALIGGLLMATATISFVVDWQNATTQLDVHAMLGLGFAAINIPLAFLIPSLTSNQSADISHMKANPIYKDFETVEDQRILGLASRYQTKKIIQFALLEGAGFLNTILLVITPNLLNLGVVAVLLGIMGVCIPRDHTVITWIESELAHDQ